MLSKVNNQPAQLQLTRNLKKNYKMVVSQQGIFVVKKKISFPYRKFLVFNELVNKKAPISK